jgi:hypothetical protein
MVRGEIKGVMVTQSYSDENLFTQKDVDLSSSVSEQITIDRKQAEENFLKSQEQIKLLSLRQSNTAWLPHQLSHTR